MTYIAGYQTQTGVVLVADTVVTSTEQLVEAPYTYFEQLQKQDLDLSVNEAAQKISAIGLTELATFAGDTDTGMRVIRFLKENINIPIEERINSMTKSLGTFDSDTHFLFATNRGNHPRLWAWRTSIPSKLVQIPENALSSAGSGKKDLDSAAIQLGRNWSHLPMDDFMVILSAGLQAAAQHSNSMKTGVGGMFMAAVLEPEIIRWIPDCSFLIYAPNNFSLDSKEASLTSLSSFSRDGSLVLCTRSPKLKSMVAEQNQIFNPGPLCAKLIPSLFEFDSSWWDTYGPEIDASTNKFSSDYYIFLSRAEPRVVVVQSHERLLNGRLVQAKSSGNKLQVSMQIEFRDYLLPEKQIGTVSAPAVVFVKR